MMGDMHCPKYADTVINIVLQPEHEVFAKQQYDPVNNGVPVDGEMVMVKEIKNCEANNKAE